jgi:hypothetical protein
VKTSLKPEELYLQLGRLVEEMPDLSTGPITPDVNKWLGRACALVEQVGDTVATVQIRTACEFLTGVNRELTAQSIVTIVHTSLEGGVERPRSRTGRFYFGRAHAARLLGSSTSARCSDNRCAHGRPVCRPKDCD